METPPRETFVTPNRAAIRLGIPASWLRREAENGRLPSLRIGRRLFVNPEDIQAALLRRTQITSAEAAHG